MHVDITTQLNKCIFWYESHVKQHDRLDIIYTLYSLTEQQSIQKDWTSKCSMRVNWM